VWVIDADSLVTRVHRALGASGYGDIRDVPAQEELSAGRIDLRVALSALGLEPVKP
jgi:hypothetical protein